MGDVVPTGPGWTLESLGPPLPWHLTGLATDAVAACAEAVQRLAAARGLPLGTVDVDSRAVAVAFSRERHFRHDGGPATAFAPLSGFFAAADGWVRLHGNYRPHADAIRRALGSGGSPGPGLEAEAGELAGAVARRSAAAVEAAVVEAGGVAAAVRSVSSWRALPQGRPSVPEAPVLAGTGARPLPATGTLGRSSSGGSDGPDGPDRPGPVAGLRVLDLTRVLAGPIAGRTLALWGADVLRVDPPGHPEIAWQHLDLDQGKRSTVLDLADPAGADRFRVLLAGADAVLLGYRPGALHGLDFGGEDLLAEFPHLVVGELSAWGWSGPWSGRRGFDSIVQAACGIADATAAGGRPGALPVQALDHATGYRLAAAVLDGLRERPDAGGRLVRRSLLQAADELLGRSPAHGQAADADLTVEPYVQTLGEVRSARPPFALAGVPMSDPAPARPYGRDAPAWLPAD